MKTLLATIVTIALTLTGCAYHGYGNGYAGYGSGGYGSAGYYSGYSQPSVGVIYRQTYVAPAHHGYGYSGHHEHGGHSSHFDGGHHSGGHSGHGGHGRHH